MNSIVLLVLRALLLGLIQVLILNNIEIQWGLYPMIYPLVILMLPFEWSTTTLMVSAFGFGLFIDAFSNTFGLHASSAVLMAYFRPQILKLFSPRDGYESQETSNINDLGFGWFFGAYGLLLLIHHTWFFTIEVFRMNELLFIARKIAISVPVSFVIAAVAQFIFMRKRRS